MSATPQAVHANAAPHPRFDASLRIALFLFALGLPISIAAGQPMAYLASALAAWGGLTGWLKLEAPRPLLLAIGLFLLFLLVSATFGWNPARAFRKMDRFFLLLVIGAVPAAMRLRTGQRLAYGPFLVNAFVAGCAVKAASDLVRIPLELSGGATLFDTGNMREPQMYLVALCLVTAAIALGRWRWREPFAASALILLSLGLLLHFKRGTWIAFALALIWMCMLMRNARPLAVFALLIGLALALPAVRTRLGMLEMEWSGDLGGRYALWTEVAPPLLASTPLGSGWKTVRHEHLAAHAETLQPGLEHLHNNLLQIALETGWGGVLAWTAWMAILIVLVTRLGLRLRTGNPEGAALPIGVSGALVGLLANGMVEYNFGDSEIFMIFLLLTGLGLLSGRLSPEARLIPPPSPGPPPVIR